MSQSGAKHRTGQLTVACAIVRTCSVRFAAMMLTQSVRSFQVPATPGTRACPPSRPSVPTSRATRVTSEENDRRDSTMLLTVLYLSVGLLKCTNLELENFSERFDVDLLAQISCCHSCGAACELDHLLAGQTHTSAKLRTCVVKFRAYRSASAC